MGVFDLFSKRKLAAQGRAPELQAQELPSKFRCQVGLLLVATIGKWVRYDYGRELESREPSNAAWLSIIEVLTREHGLYALGRPGDLPVNQCLDYLHEANTDEALDLIEVGLRVIDHDVRRWHRGGQGPGNVLQLPDSALAEFNTRCRENGVGYAYENGRIIPVSSTFIHTQVVEPAFQLLHDEGFRGAQDEFLRAHANLRRGDTKGAILEAGKAFESAMKTVCAQKKWAYDPHKTTASGLVAILFEKGLVPSYLQEQFTSLRKVFESGVPTVRNKTSGHGQGPEPVEIPRELAEYAIHLTAANIVFLAKRLRELGAR